jgi:hypothetical protein
MVNGNVADCEKDHSCARQVALWSSLLEKPRNHPDPVLRVHGEFTPENGAPELANRSFAFKDAAAGGATLRIGGEDGIRLSLGRSRFVYATSWEVSYAQPELYAEILRSPRDPEKGEANLAAIDVKLDVVLPQVGMFSALSPDSRTVEVSRWSQEPGGLVKLSLKAEIGDATRKYAAKIDVETFVLDVIDVAQKNDEPHP